MADPRALFALFDWTAIAAPDLFPLLSGHYNLTVGAIQRLGSGSEQQRKQLELLDDASHVGVFLLTELGFGSNVLEMQTEAVWDQKARRFLLTTPNGAACKFMPNVAAADVPRITVVAARLKVDGKDEGIFPFIVPLRTGEGAAAGVEVMALPDKGWAPMDNAMIRFDHVPLPYDAWLSGDMARIEDDGTFVCSIPAHDRFRRAIEQLQAGRIALSAGAVASARAALWLTTRYAAQRRTAGGIVMMDRDNVRRALASCAARVYAATALTNAVRRRFIDPASHPGHNALLAMLTKPLLSGTALAVLQECRERCGAQGMFRVNRITDYIGNAQGVITAEGENQVLQVAAGRALRPMLNGRGAVPTISDSLGELAWWHDLLIAREHALAAALVTKDGAATATTSIGPSCYAIDLAGATADRLAVDALTTAAHDAAPPAQELVRTLAAVYALEKIQAHAGWYTATGRLTPDRAADVARQLNAGYRMLAAHLPALVAAFEIPDLAAPIADDYITAWLEFAGWTHLDQVPPGQYAAPPALQN
jgi:acyl-CoA oxidase